MAPKRRMRRWALVRGASASSRNTGIASLPVPAKISVASARRRTLLPVSHFKSRRNRSASGDLGRIDIESNDVEAGAMKCRQQRQADIAQADDADSGALGGNLGENIHGYAPITTS
jgi:hypothetical protein